MSGRTSKQIAAGHVRSLRAMREKLLRMAAEWDEIDQFCMSQLEALADQAEQTAVDLKDDDYDDK